MWRKKYSNEEKQLNKKFINKLYDFHHTINSFYILDMIRKPKTYFVYYPFKEINILIELIILQFLNDHFFVCYWNTYLVTIRMSTMLLQNRGKCFTSEFQQYAQASTNYEFKETDETNEVKIINLFFSQRNSKQ